MKPLIYILLPVLLLINAVGVNAEKLNVIVNKNSGVESLDIKNIRKIFLGRPFSLTNNKVLSPIDLVRTDPVYEVFYSSVIKKTRAQADSYWSRKLFNGTGTPPLQLNNVKDVIQWVEKNDNSIGYVRGDVSSDKVIVILSLDI